MWRSWTLLRLPWRGISSDLSTTLFANDKRILSRPGNTLPDLSQGGIVLFLHIPKTGGITIREMFSSLQKKEPKRFQSIVLSRKGEWKRWQWQLSKRFRSFSRNKLFYIEIHGGGDDLNYLHHQQDVIQSWLAMARMNKVPVFAFTVVREPTDYALSHFEFYHVSDYGGNHAERFVQVNKASEEALQTHHVPNAQCLFLTKGESAYSSASRNEVLREASLDECRTAFHGLRRDFDWIGVTASLSSETIPLLQRAMNVTRSPVRIGNRNRRKTLAWDNLSPTTQSSIRQTTAWDEELYRNTNKLYNFQAYSQ